MTLDQSSMLDNSSILNASASQIEYASRQSRTPQKGGGQSGYELANRHSYITDNSMTNQSATDISNYTNNFDMQIEFEDDVLSE